MKTSSWNRVQQASEDNIVTIPTLELLFNSYSNIYSNRSDYTGDSVRLFIYGRVYIGALRNLELLN